MLFGASNLFLFCLGGNFFETLSASKHQTQERRAKMLLFFTVREKVAIQRCDAEISLNVDFSRANLLDK